jgi:hypothetical protein
LDCTIDGLVVLFSVADDSGPKYFEVVLGGIHCGGGVIVTINSQGGDVGRRQYGV